MIIDKAGLIKDPDALMAAMTEYYKLSGVCPVFISIYEEDWRKDGKTYLIQVAYSVAEDKAYEREFSAFSYIDNSVKKIIITNDDIDYSTSTVYHYKLKDFLMMDEL